MRWSFLLHTRNVGTFAIASVLLSGCGAFRSWDAPAPSPAPVPERASGGVEAPVARAAPLVFPPARNAAKVNPPQAKPATPIVPAPVVSIAGLSEDDVVRVMGEPQMRAERNGRRIWTYRGAACHVEVTFFRDVTRDAYAALAHKVVQAGGATGGSCLRDMRRGARE